MTGGNHTNLQYHLGDTVIYTSPTGEETSGGYQADFGVRDLPAVLAA